MKKIRPDRIKACRYIPGFNGSPAWMSYEEAHNLSVRDTAYVHRMIDIMQQLGDEESVRRWAKCYPQIEVHFE